MSSTTGPSKIPARGDGVRTRQGAPADADATTDTGTGTDTDPDPRTDADTGTDADTRTGAGAAIGGTDADADARPEAGADGAPLTGDAGLVPRGPRLLLLGLPVAAVLVLAVVDAAALRAIVEGTLGSPRALLIVTGVIAATVGWSALVRRVIGEGWLHTALVLLPLGVVVGLYVGPYFGGDTVVEEDFPVALDDGPQGAIAGSSDDADTGSDAGGPDAGAGLDADAGADARPDDAVTATAPPGSGAAAPNPAEAAAPEPVTQEPPAQEVPAQEAPAQEAPAQEPVELGRGSFVGLDNHRAAGEAAAYDLGAGAVLVRLEDVDLQPVPAPVVYLVPQADATAPIEGSIDLGVLKGNVGSQNYEVPAEVDLATGGWTVLVWCETFSSPVGGATLSSAA